MTIEYADVVELGSEPSAAGGGNSEVSEWPRSARRKSVLTGAAAAGHCNRKTHWIFPNYKLLTKYLRMWWNW